MEFLNLPILFFNLSLSPGILGLGVVLKSTRIFGLFRFDIKHVIMPWNHLWNGLTLASNAVAYKRFTMVVWWTAVPLLVLTTIVAPTGFWILQFAPTSIVCWVDVGVLFFLAYCLVFPLKKIEGKNL